MIKQISDELKGSSKPVIKVILKSDDTKIIAIGMRSEVVFSDHKAPALAKIIVLQGQINYISQQTDLILNHLDEYDIPRDEVHKVVAIDDAVFLVVMHDA